MADYNQNIKVTADIKQAESQLNRLTKALQNLKSDAWIEFGKSSASKGIKLAERNLKDYGRTLGAIDRQLGGFGKRLADVAKAFDFGAKTALGVAGINALGSALGSLPKVLTGGSRALQTFGGVLEGLTTPATKVAAALASLGPQGLAAAGGIAAATAAFMAFSPAVRKVVTGLDNLALGGKIQSALGGMKGKVEETKQSFLGLNTTIETTVQAMNELAEGMSLRQLNTQVSSLTKEMQSFHSSTQGAWEAAQGLVRAQKAQVVEQRALNELVRQAKGLQPQDVRDAEVSRRKANLTSGRNAQEQLSKQARETEQLQQALLKLEQTSADLENNKLQQRWELDQAAAAKLRAETEALATQLEKIKRASNTTGIRKTEASAAVQERKQLERTVALMRERNAMLQGNANQYGGMAGPGNDTRANQPQYRQMLNEQVLAARNLGKERRIAMEMADRELLFETRLAQIMEKRAAAQKKINSGKRGSGFSDRLQNSLVSGSFPLLFGAGPAATIGGFVGGGLGASNPMFGVFTSAIGQLMDQFAAAAQTMGNALRDPITNFQQIADAGLLASKSQEYYVKRLIEVGRVTEATAVIQAELIKKIGATGINDLQRLGTASDRLTKAWAELNLQMQAAIAGPLASLLEWITQVVGVLGASNRAGSRVKDVLGSLTPEQQQKLQGEMLRNNQRYGTSEKAIAEENKILSRYEALGKKPTVKSELGPEAAAAALKASKEQADLIQSAYREAFDLQRRGIDLQREMTDYRRKAESDIFAKAQEAKRLEIDNARKAAQINIEQTDLALRKQFSGSQGLTAELLGGVRAYISARRNGEADIEQKRRQLEVNLADINKATADYVYEQTNRRMQLERSIEDYKRDIADYQLKVARQIQEVTPTDPAGGIGGGAGRSQSGGAFSKWDPALLRATAQLDQKYKVPLGTTASLVMFESSGNTAARGPDVGGGDRGHGLFQIMRGTASELGVNHQSILGMGGVQQMGLLDKYLAGRGFRPGMNPEQMYATVLGGNPWARSRDLNGTTPGSGAAVQRGWRGSAALAIQAAGLAPTSTGGQLATAGGSIAAPAFSAPSGSTAGFTAAQERIKEVTKKSVELESQHVRLKQQVAAFDLQEVARGQAQTQQLQTQLDTEKAKLGVITTVGGLSENQLALILQQKEGESKIADIVNAQKTTLLEINTALKEGKLTQDEANELIKQINTGVESRLNNTRVQIALEQDLLKVQQAQQLAMEAQNMQRQLMATGQGIKAGYTGGASGKYDDIYGKTGDSKLAGQFADAQGVLDQLQNAQSDASALGGSIAGGFKEALKAAVTGGDIKGAFASMLGGLGEKFLEMAFRPIEQSLTQAIFGMLAPSNAQVQAATQMMAAAQIQLQAGTLMSGSGGLGGAAGGIGGLFGGGSMFGGLGSMFSGGGAMSAAGVGFNPIAFTPGLSFFAGGGFVTGPTNARIGEGGSNEYVIPENKMDGAMAKWSAGARGDSVVNGADPTSGGGIGGPEGAPQININGGILQFNDAGYIRQDQLPSIINQASKRGEALAMRRLQMNPSTRRKIGLN